MCSAHWLTTPGTYSELRSWENENGLIDVADRGGGSGGGDHGGDDVDDDCDNDDDDDDDNGGGGGADGRTDGGADGGADDGVADACSNVFHWSSGLVASCSKLSNTIGLLFSIKDLDPMLPSKRFITAVSMPARACLKIGIKCTSNSDAVTNWTTVLRACKALQSTSKGGWTTLFLPCIAILSLPTLLLSCKMPKCFCSSGRKLTIVSPWGSTALHELYSRVDGFSPTAR